MSSTASVSQCLANIFTTFSSTIASLLLQILVARRRAGEGKKLCNLFSDQIIAVTGGNIPHTKFSPAPIPSPHYKQDSSATAVSLKTQTVGLPWWRSGWESACRCKGHRFEPWSGKISHAAEQLGPWATTTEPACLEPGLHNKRGCDSERPAHRDEEWPPLAATGESPRTETKTQHSQK